MGLRAPISSTIDCSTDALEELRLLEEKVKLQENLPHKHGWKLYEWAHQYMQSRAKIKIICAANQISKSSTQIRHHIDWATDIPNWPTLWRTNPLQFWYLYPTRDVAHVEFMKKWVPEFMPRGEYRYDHPQYGWKPEIYHGRIFAIHWNSGVSTYFKTYAQDVQDLQTGTVWKLDLDEETPEDLMSELFMRLAATDGYMSAVFTPTIGQEYWRLAIEERGNKEKFPDAFKRQVSMYDCLRYADGSRSPWTVEQIRRAENSCKSPQEIEKRIHGKFTVAEGLKYPSFHRSYNRKEGHPVPKDWTIWCGVDPGSGGENHPAAIALVAVSPDYRMGRVIKGWRGDGVTTTAGDVVKKTIDMVREYDGNVRIMYDHGCRDFYQIAMDMGLAVEPAEKSHVVGETMLNVLFKNQMLMVYNYPELDDLCIELATLKNSTPKNKAKDDFVDALRYAISKIPWDWGSIRTDSRSPAPKKELTAKEEEMRARRGLTSSEDNLVDVDGEIEEWNKLMGNYDYD